MNNEARLASRGLALCIIQLVNIMVGHRNEKTFGQLLASWLETGNRKHIDHAIACCSPSTKYDYDVLLRSVESLFTYHPNEMSLLLFLVERLKGGANEDLREKAVKRLCGILGDQSNHISTEFGVGLQPVDLVEICYFLGNEASIAIASNLIVNNAGKHEISIALWFARLNTEQRSALVLGRLLRNRIPLGFVCEEFLAFCNELCVSFPEFGHPFTEGLYLDFMVNRLIERKKTRWRVARDILSAASYCDTFGRNRLANAAIRFPDPIVRVRALEILAREGDGLAVEELTRVVSDPVVSFEVRRALKSLQRIIDRTDDYNGPSYDFCEWVFQQPRYAMAVVEVSEWQNMTLTWPPLGIEREIDIVKFSGHSLETDSQKKGFGVYVDDWRIVSVAGLDAAPEVKEIVGRVCAEDMVLSGRWGPDRLRDCAAGWDIVKESNTFLEYL